MTGRAVEWIMSRKIGSATSGGGNAIMMAGLLL